LLEELEDFGSDWVSEDLPVLSSGFLGSEVAAVSAFLRSNIVLASRLTASSVALVCCAFSWFC
jgi:hypothetical protein